jgi:hypothetical protein
VKPHGSAAKPQVGARVRHATTGDVGTMSGHTGDGWFRWALVRWDDGGPGMCDEQGLSRVAPGLLEHCGTSQRAGGRS